ncbi:MAG TPA: serine hydrolase domain-containing protein [Planctomycetia bacterium]|nr:serine hydrolase domain-containing protein [Planctomycetia bacterium]
MTLASFFALALSLAADSPASPEAAVDAAVAAHMKQTRTPAIGVAVVKAGKPILVKGYGVANLEHDVKATAKTRFQLASVTKQFTAAAILMLVEDGKLKLDAKVTEILPNLPAAWAPVTVRHLLTHTSGIKSYTDLPDFMSKTTRQVATPKMLVDAVKDFPLQFKPGEKFAYSNTGYFLLGMIVEKASGTPYGKFVAARIFKPLGMETARHDDEREIIPGRAAGHTLSMGTPRNSDFLSMTWPGAAGALIASAEDMAKWAVALDEGKVLTEARRKEMWTPPKLASGAPSSYGYGWGIAKVRGYDVVSHGGGINGFSTDIARYVDEKLTVVVLCNLNSGAAGLLGRKIAACYMPALATPDKTIADDNPKFTERVKAALLAARSGKPDPEHYAEAARKALFPDRIKEAGGFLKSLGELKSLELLESQSAGKQRALRYRAVFGDTKLSVRCSIGDDLKIAAIGLQPE